MAESDARANQKHVINFAWPYFLHRNFFILKGKGPQFPLLYFNNYISYQWDKPDGFSLFVEFFAKPVNDRFLILLQP